MASTITQTIRTGSPITASVAHAGARGAAGLKGDPGDKGDKGDPGDPGAPGVAAAHAATHATGGDDALSPAAIGAATLAQVTAAVAAEASARDVAIGLAVAAGLNALLDGAPGALDTLNELAAAVNDDASFAASVTAALATKIAEGDPRLTNARPPTAHAASHAEGGADAITLTLAQITGLVAALAAKAVARGAWATATVYAVNDLVASSSTLYRCLVAHASGTFAADLAAAKWEVLLAGGGGSGVTTTEVQQGDPGYDAGFSADSDDFDGGALDADWSTVNIGTATVTVGDGRVVIKRLAADNTDNWRGIVRACPAGAWEFEVVLGAFMSTAGASGGGNWSAACLAVRRGGGTPPNASNTSTDKLVAVGIGSNASTPNLVGLNSTATNAVTSTLAALSGTRTLGPTGRFRVAFNGADTLTFKYSPFLDPGSDVDFLPVWTGSATTFLGGAPDSIGLLLEKMTTLDGIMVAKYCRRVA